MAFHNPPAERPHTLLDYAAPGTDPPRRRWLDLPALGLALPAVLAPFVSFTWGTSPLDVLVATIRNWRDINLQSGFDTLILIAAPFFIGPLLCACRLRMLIRPALRSAERRFLWMAAMVSVSCSLAFLGQGVFHSFPRQLEEIITYVLPLTILAIGGLLLFRAHRLCADRIACFAVTVAYVAAVSIPLYGFHEYPEIGWWLTLAAASVLTLDSALLLIPRRVFRFTPALPVAPDPPQTP